MKQNLTTSLKQQAVFSTQMQRALALLQLPVMELSTLIAKELEENPVLEYSDENNFEEIDLNFKKTVLKKEDEDLKAFLENTISYEHSLFDYLMEQARDVFKGSDLKIAEEVIGNFDESGFLATNVDEIALLSDLKAEKIEEILTVIQQFDPPGVGAKNLQESLLIQLAREGKSQTLAYKVVAFHFDDVIHNKIPQIAKKMQIGDRFVIEAIEKEIMRLDFHPGTSFPRGHYAEENATISPDVIISGKDCQIEINEKYIPSFRINPYYLQMLAGQSMTKETKDYINGKISSGKWLLRNLDERNHTLYRIAEILVEKQSDFLTDINGKLTPLTMKETAEQLGLNESTVARAVSNKHVGCLRGIVPLRSFFTHAMQIDDGTTVSVNTIKDCLLELIKKESKKKPLSDLALSKQLKENGFIVARRTVAKYRMELGLGTVSQRRSFIS